MKWINKDLSGEGCEFLYRGKIYVRPIGRGVVLEDLEHQPHLDDVLDEGFYEAEIRIIRKVPAPDSP